MFCYCKILSSSSEFTGRCVAAFESMGDAATHSHAHDEAIEQYSVALSLNPPAAQGLYLKRSKGRALKGIWDDAISDANEVQPFILRYLVFDVMARRLLCSTLRAPGATRENTRHSMVRSDLMRLSMRSRRCFQRSKSPSIRASVVSFFHGQWRLLTCFVTFYRTAPELRVTPGDSSCH